MYFKLTRYNQNISCHQRVFQTLFVIGRLKAYDVEELDRPAAVFKLWRYVHAANQLQRDKNLQAISYSKTKRWQIYSE